MGAHHSFSLSYSIFSALLTRPTTVHAHLIQDAPRKYIHWIPKPVIFKSSMLCLSWSKINMCSQNCTLVLQSGKIPGTPVNPENKQHNTKAYSPRHRPWTGLWPHFVNLAIHQLYRWHAHLYPMCQLIPWNYCTASLTVLAKSVCLSSLSNFSLPIILQAIAWRDNSVPCHEILRTESCRQHR